MGKDEIMGSVETVPQAQLDARVLRSERPVALDFYQASCPPCRVLEPRLERVARDYEGRLRVYRVNIDRVLRVAQRSGIMSIPTILLLKGGQELDGLITEQDLRAAFDRAVGRQ